jgi:PAS domain S-box-containing protein
MLPYIGLQIRAVLKSFTILTGLEHSNQTILVGHFADEAMVLMIGVITILFGLRRVDTRRRQSGLIAVLAVEALTKLVAFLAVGAFVTWGLFDGFGDLQAQAAANVPMYLKYGRAPEGSAYINWMTYFVLSMSAIVFLPRMFHVMVVENVDERHLTTAMWALPLYLLLISLFVLPIAFAGQLLGYPVSEADWLLLHLPFDSGQTALAILVYLGGLAASVGMIMVACTTMAIMFSNHIVLPVFSALNVTRGSGVQVLRLRWLIVFVLILSAYAFEQGLKDSYLLIQMGLISFASVAQFIPAVIGALYWRGASTRGAWLGLAAGWVVWFYSLFLPAAVRSGAGAVDWLQLGPWGVESLRPEALFGLDLGSALTNGVFWSLLINVIGFVAGSLRWPAIEDEDVADRYAGRRSGGLAASAGGDASIDLARVVLQSMALIVRYLPPDEAEKTMAVLLGRSDLADHDGAISASQFITFTKALEVTLAGVIGPALARQVVSKGIELTDDEQQSLQYSYAETLAEMRITPEDLRQRIEHFKSISALSLEHTERLKTEVEERTHDLTEALAKARDSEEIVKSITQSAQDAVIMLDPEGKVSFWNPAAERTFGWMGGEVIGAQLEDFLLPERFRSRHAAGYARFQRGESSPAIGNSKALVALTHDGQEVDVEVSLSSVEIKGRLYAVGVMRDIRERVAAEAALNAKLAELQALNQQLEEAQGQLLQSEKMASIGQLAAGVAHEINNPIGFINSNLGTLKGYCRQMFDLLSAYEKHASAINDPAIQAAIAGARKQFEIDYLREDLPELLKESEEGLKRVKRIVQDLKNFSHVNESEWQFADLNAGLDSTLNVVWNEVKYKATVEKDYGQLPQVRCLAAQLNQVFMNLIVNASHAIDASRGLGLINLATGQQGDEVWVEVRDSGHGMSEEIQRRVFEPFFTTKPVGKGTGLGLSLSFGIVKKHGGRIEVSSELGQGTRFRVWLPVAGPEAPDDMPEQVQDGS